MKMKTTLLLFLGIFLARSAFAQAVPSMNLSLDKLKIETLKDVQTGQPTDRQVSLDLWTEAKRQNPALSAGPTPDLTRVEMVLKSGELAADAFLVVNNLTVDSQSVETEPGEETKITLKNIERRVTSAWLKIIGDATLKSVTLFFGAIQDVAVVGSYASADASRVAGATPAPEREPVTLVRPPKDVIRPNGGSVAPAGTETATSAPVTGTAAPGTPGVEGPQRPPQGPAPAGPQAVAPRPAVPAPRPPTWAEMNCYRNYCVGDTVANRFGIEGTIVRVYPQRGQLEIKFTFTFDPVLRTPEQIRWLHR